MIKRVSSSFMFEIDDTSTQNNINRILFLYFCDNINWQVVQVFLFSCVDLMFFFLVSFMCVFFLFVVMWFVSTFIDGEGSHLDLIWYWLQMRIVCVVSNTSQNPCVKWSPHVRIIFQNITRTSIKQTKTNMNSYIEQKENERK